MRLKNREGLLPLLPFCSRVVAVASSRGAASWLGLREHRCAVPRCHGALALGAVAV